jgi:hypothetical protein
MDHLFQCDNKEMRKRRSELVLDVGRKLLKAGFPRVVMEMICGTLRNLDTGQAEGEQHHPGLRRAREAQVKIGRRLLPRGILAREWTVVLEEFSVPEVERKISRLLKILWFDYTHKIWLARNDIAHDKQSITRKLEEATWAERLLWFQRNQQVLARKDRDILQYLAEAVAKMTGYMRKKLEENVERLREVYARELMVRENGQSLITQFFARVL